MRLGVFVGALLIVVGCDHAEQVRGPDGEMNWWNIHCRHDAGRCYALAAEQCPSGYVMAGATEHNGAYSTATTYGNTTSITTTPTFRGELLIKCKEAEVSVPDPEPLARRRRVSELCIKASEHLRDLANAFVEANPGREPVDELPARESFIKRCEPLPEAAQLCLNATYLRGHKPSCDEAFAQAEDRDWLLLEHLFLTPERH